MQVCAACVHNCAARVTYRLSTYNPSVGPRASLLLFPGRVGSKRKDTVGPPPR